MAGVEKEEGAGNKHPEKHLQGGEELVQRPTGKKQNERKQAAQAPSKVSRRRQRFTRVRAAEKSRGTTKGHGFENHEITV